MREKAVFEAFTGARQERRRRMGKKNEMQKCGIYAVLGTASRVGDKVLGWLYPRRCPVCRQIVLPRGELACPDCRRNLKYIRQPACMKCGCQLEREELEYCSSCRVHSRAFDRGYAVWQYDSRMKRSLADFKYHARKEFADFYTAEAVRIYGRQLLAQAPEVLIPVPVHPARRRERGFNQAELLASGIGKRLGLPVDSRSLKRVKKTAPLKELGRADRARTLKDAFTVSWRDGRPCRSVLLVDDIFTTGSTVDECAKALRRAGTERIIFLCMAAGVSDG